MTDPATPTPETPAPVPYTTIKVGDTVLYTPAFLASIGTSHTDPMWRKRGTVLEQHATIEQFVKVNWNDGEEPMLVNKANIAKPLTARAVDVPVWYNAPRPGAGKRLR